MKPFASGFQYLDWDRANCGTCERMRGADTHGGDWDEVSDRCDLYTALVEACLGSGEITDEQATRIGAKRGDCRYMWRCAEWSPRKTPEQLWEEQQVEGQGRLWAPSGVAEEK